jgi:hypothetical protein
MMKIMVMGKIVVLLLLISGFFGIMNIFLFRTAHTADAGERDRHISENVEKFVVAPTAMGWNLILSEKNDSDSSTVLINPDGKRFDIGKTLFLRCPKTILWGIRESKLNEKFLMIYFHPSASGAVPAYLFHLNQNNIPTLSAKIFHHYELDVRDRNGIARCGIADGGKYGKEVVKVFFTDSDNDGIPELKENDVWKWGGKITYYKWVKNESIFKPLWIEIYADYQRIISREKVYYSKTREEQIREWSEK